MEQVAACGSLLITNFSLGSAVMRLIHREWLVNPARSTRVLYKLTLNLPFGISIHYPDMFSSWVPEYTYIICIWLKYKKVVLLVPDKLASGVVFPVWFSVIILPLSLNFKETVNYHF